jgi:glycine/D-amino acid oxidase-like deaminating enzyme
MGPKVLVIGAGIIGANAAYQLQKGGADVTVIDAGKQNATQASFGWINASFFKDNDHYRLRANAIDAYSRLEAEVSLPLSWCGCLCWETEGAAFDEQRDELQALGYGVREIGAAEFGLREPHVARPPEQCLFFPREAAIESGAAADALLIGAVALGARVLSGILVQGFENKGGRVIAAITDAGRITADHIVVAAGTATQSLMKTAGFRLPMLRRPALMIRTRPVALILKHVLVSEIGEVRQLPDGSLLMPAAISHQADEADQLSGAIEHEAHIALNRLQNFVPKTSLNLSHATVAYRPVPEDGLPVVGSAMDGLYVATMHSGMTLGALMGELIATEVLNGPTNDTGRQLAPYRLARFAPQ